MIYTELTGENYLNALRAEGELFIAAAMRAGFDAAVPSCPEWDVGDLVFHTGRVHRWFYGMLSTGGEDPKTRPKITRPETDLELPAWYSDGLELIHTYLSAVGDNDAVWTFTGGDVGRWPKRRQAQEVLMHRFDAELAAGSITNSDPVLCADGIDEAFGVFLPNKTSETPLPGSVHLHCTDTHGEWMLTPNEGKFVVTREHGKGDVALRGPAQLLLLVVMRRVSLDDALQSGAELFGSREALDALIELTRF